MNEILETTLSTIIITVVPILATYVVKAINTYRAKKGAEIENLKAREYFLQASQLIEQVVVATTQTYVERLKKDGVFDAEAQRVAFETTKNIVLQMLAEETRDFIESIYGDIDVWLDTKIEELVKKNKGV